MDATIWTAIGTGLGAVAAICAVLLTLHQANRASARLRKEELDAQLSAIDQRRKKSAKKIWKALKHQDDCIDGVKKLLQNFPYRRMSDFTTLADRANEKRNGNGNGDPIR